MNNKNLKVLSLLFLVTPLLVACGGKGGTSSTGGDSDPSVPSEPSTPSEPSETSEPEPEPQPVEMTYEEALALIGSESAVEATEAVTKYEKKTELVSNTTQAIYMSLKATDEEGKEVDFKDYDSWSYSEETSATYTNKVMESHTLTYGGDAHTTVTKTSEFQTLDSSVQARYITDNLIGIFKDETGLTYDDDDNLVPYETHGLDCAYGQAYSDWWDKTYGKYAAAYVGMNSLEKYDEQCFSDYLSVNDTIANQLAYYGDDYYEDGVAPVTSVEANEAKASLSFSIGGDYSATLSDVAYDSGYEGWVDAEIYQNINIDVEFDTPTGVITKFVIGQEYYIKNNPNTGATLETPFVIQTQVSEYSGFETLGEFTGTLKQVGDEFDVRYYDIFYKDAEHYWFFNFSQGVPCPYQVDLTATKLNKAMTDGFSWSNPATYNADGSITLPGAKAHAYTDEEGQSKTIKYTYTFSLDADGNLVSTYVNEKNETVTETYYSSANFAKQ